MLFSHTVIFQAALTEWKLFDVTYQTQKTMFDHISKHREESWNTTRNAASIFDELQGVWYGGQTLSWVFDISSQLRRTQRNKIVKIYAN